MSSSADRTRELRRRLREGLAVATIEYNEQRVIEAMIRAEYLTEETALDPHEVARALALVVEDWTRLWFEKE